MDYKKHIIIDRSFDQVQEEQSEYSIKQNPVDRIKETVQLILRVFSADEKKPNTNRIYIDKV